MVKIQLDVDGKVSGVTDENGAVVEYSVEEAQPTTPAEPAGEQPAGEETPAPQDGEGSQE